MSYKAYQVFWKMIEVVFFGGRVQEVRLTQCAKAAG